MVEIVGTVLGPAIVCAPSIPQCPMCLVLSAFVPLVHEAWLIGSLASTSPCAAYLMYSPRIITPLYNYSPDQCVCDRVHWIQKTTEFQKVFYYIILACCI